MNTIKTAGVLAHPLRPQTAPVAERIADSLRACNIDTWLYAVWEEQDVLAQVGESDMIVAIGGDGAMLRAARACAPYDVPVLGVNTGYLGFLAEINELETWDQYLYKLLKGQYWIENRMMLQTCVLRDGKSIETGHALNDAVISRGIVARTVRLETFIDAEWATTYNADALIIASPTGSTAYALAAGGPILPPELRNILIVPVAPHLSMNRPIVLSEGSTVEVIPGEDARTEIVLTIDGVLACDLEAGDHVQIRASQYVSRFIRLRERNYFYRSLLDRMEPRFSTRSTLHPTEG